MYKGDSKRLSERVSAREKLSVETGKQERKSDGPDTYLRPTIISLKINKYCRIVLTTLFKGNVLLKRLNDH